MTKNATPSVADRTVIGDYEIEGKQRNLKDVADGTVLVGQIRQVFDSLWQISMIIDVELVSIEWAFQFSIENDGSGNRTYQRETEIGMTVTSGKEVSESVSANAGFSGWGFSAEIDASKETKTFNTAETSKKTRVTDTYSIPPESSIFVYKKQYKFRCRPWIYLDLGKVWLEHNGKKCEAHFNTEIIANQELISPVELTNHGRITNNPPSDLIQPTKGHTLGGGVAGTVLYALLKNTYPWLP